MKLLAKFTLIFVTVFGVGICSIGYLFYKLLRENARAEVLHEATLMMDTALAMRRYTTDEIAPALVECEKQTRADKRVFYPQTIPAFAATSVFARLFQIYPDYHYKEASANPMNPRNRAVDWEEDIINELRSRPDLPILRGERETPVGQSLFVAKPLRPPAQCLQCHSTAANAPPEMVRIYGTTNGFGWTPGEVVAAQIVSVPASLALARANRAFRNLVVTLVVVCAIALVVLDLLLYLTVVRSVTAFSAQADQISQGQLNLPELPVRGKDEISILALAFNRMYWSIKASIEMLNKVEQPLKSPSGKQGGGARGGRADS